MVFRVDFKEMVEHYEKHGGASEEDGEGVKLAVGYHLDRAYFVGESLREWQSFGRLN